jgi:hypothetical protein
MPVLPAALAALPWMKIGIGAWMASSMGRQLLETVYGQGIQKDTLGLQKKQMESQTEGMKMAFKEKQASSDKLFQQMMAIRNQDRQAAGQAQQTAMVMQLMQSLMAASSSMRRREPEAINPAMAAGLIR